jgi:hypothetical protein
MSNVKNLFSDNGILWSIRANDISGNYSQVINLDSSSNFAFSRSGSKIATLGSNVIASSYINGLDVSGTYFSNSVSAIQIPADTSANRPAGQAGYIRYNTNINLIEYWNAATNSWVSISEQPPSITSISPSWIGEDQSNNFTVTGNNFNSNSVISFIGNVNSVEYPAASTTYSSSTQLTTINSVAMTDVSANTAFYVKVVNTNTSFNFTTSTAILSHNLGPYWISPAANASVGTGIIDQNYTKITTPFIDLSANDSSTPPNYPITFFNSTTGLLPSGVLMDASNGKLYGTMPATPATYGFSAYPQDASGVQGPPRTFSFTVNSKFMTVSYTGIQATNTYSSGGYTYRWVAWRPASNTTSTTSYLSAINVSYTSGISPFNQIEFLIVGGGGGGGSGWQGGGGGAGGLISSGGSIGGSGGGGLGVGAYAAPVGVYNINVGGGGLGGFYSTSGSNAVPTNGGNSSLFGYTAIGGGSGAGEQNLGSPSLTPIPPASGGSGGGGSHGGGSSVGGGAGTVNQGYAGGTGISGGLPATYNGGGGGGAGAVGGNSTGNTSPDVAGSGGIGITNAIAITNSVPTPTYYAGGGGGSSRSGTAGSGGTGGGGAGGANASGTSGTVGTGGGGGSASSSSGGFPGETGGNGGTGIVIIRYIISMP